MIKGKSHYLWLRLLALAAACAALLALSLACAAPEPTPTPVPPAPPTHPTAPAYVPTPTTTPAPGAPTPATAAPTPTRVVPTPTAMAASRVIYGGTLRMARLIDAKTFEITKSTNTAEREVLFIIYNNPVKLDPDFNILPDLAQSWEFSAEGKEITFRFAKGVKFHDGTSFNADAFKWQIDRHLNKEVASLQRSILEPAVEGVRVVNDETAILRLKAPFRPILAALADRSGSIESPSAFQKLGDKYGAKPVGTGSFTLSEWIPDSHITLKRFDNYWEKGKPYLDTMRFQNVPDSSVQLAMLRTGETDIVKDIPAKDIKLLQNSPNVALARLEGARWDGLQISVDREPWSNKALRQAMAYAVDRKTILSTYFDGLGRVAYQPVGSGWSYNPDIKVYDYDLKKAKEKMVEAGYPNGIDVTMWCKSSPSDVQLCEIYQAQLKEVGIRLKIDLVLPADEYTLALQRKTHFRRSYWIPRGDPHGLIQILFHSKGGQNSTGYNNPEVDRLIDDAAQIYDSAKAKVLYEKAYRIMTEDAPYIYVVYPTAFTAMNAKVRNFEYIPDAILRMRDLWMEK